MQAFDKNNYNNSRIKPNLKSKTYHSNLSRRDLLAGVTVSSCYFLEEALYVPVVSMEGQEGHNLISLC